MTRKWPDPQNILVRMPNWVGDLVMATPVLSALRERFPKSSITAMCQGSVGELLRYDPRIDAVFQFAKPEGLKRKEMGNDLRHSLRLGCYDLGLLLTNSISSAWLLWRGGVKRRIGFRRDLRTVVLSQSVPPPDRTSTAHQVLDYQQLLVPLGITPTPRPLMLYVRPEERLEAAQLLEHYGVSKERSCIGINPGAAFGSAKCWLPERFREVTERLLQRTDHTIIYFGDIRGAPLVKEICEGMGGRVVNMAGCTSLRQLMALIERCQLLLTNDSGPMHIAAALKVPLLALFGSTSDVKTGPYQHGRVIHKHVDCSPCFQQSCPLDFRCMRRISVDEVFEEVRHILNEAL